MFIEKKYKIWDRLHIYYSTISFYIFKREELVSCSNLFLIDRSCRNIMQQEFHTEKLNNTVLPRLIIK